MSGTVRECLKWYKNESNQQLAEEEPCDVQLEKALEGKKTEMKSYSLLDLHCATNN